MTMKQVNVSNELCDAQLGKQLCLESVPTGIPGIMHIFGFVTVLVVL